MPKVILTHRVWCERSVFGTAELNQGEVVHRGDSQVAFWHSTAIRGSSGAGNDLSIFRFGALSIESRGSVSSKNR